MEKERKKKDHRKRRSVKTTKRRLRGNQYTGNDNKIVKEVIEDIIQKVANQEKACNINHNQNITTDNTEFCAGDISVLNNSTDVNETFDRSMNTTASYDKLVGHQILDGELDRASTTPVIDFKGGYQIIDTSILDTTFNLFACPDCFEVGQIEFSKIKKQGLASYVVATEMLFL